MSFDPGFDTNIALLSEMVDRLGDVADALVFVGGCATGLLVTVPRAQVVRGTRDVDVVAEVTTIREYHEIEARVAERGFKRDWSLICRWQSGGLQLDLLPSGPGVLGFHNRWYPLAVATAAPFKLQSGRPIRLVTAPLFVATKLEAFSDRGRGDFRASHDLEDIITVVDGRPELVDEVRGGPPEVREYMRDRLANLLADEAFVTALQGHLPGDAASQGRVPLVLERLRELVAPR